MHEFELYQLEIFFIWMIKSIFADVYVGIYKNIFRTFEVYASELETGKLEWSPPHQSENFWQKNAVRLNEHDHRLLK